MEDSKIIEGLRKVSERNNLDAKEAEDIMKEIMLGRVSNAQLGAFLVALKMKGESIDEITGFAKAMRNFSNQITPKVQGDLIDTCGTGGDKIKTFNISTVSAFVVSGAGVAVAKHGNRAVTSKCGSADLLEGLGVNINLDPEGVKKCIENVGIGFMFAPLFHPAMKYAMSTRKELKIRTVFNILGPLTNPANAKCHTLGVFDKDLVPIMAKVLGNGLGAKHVFAVHNSYGIDELVPFGINYITEFCKGNCENYAITNKDFNIADCTFNDVLAGSLNNNLEIAVNILKNKIIDAKYNTVLMNAAISLTSAGVAKDFKDGVAIAKESLQSGKAFEKLEKLIQFSGGNLDRLKSLI